MLSSTTHRNIFRRVILCGGVSNHMPGYSYLPLLLASHNIAITSNIEGCMNSLVGLAITVAASLPNNVDTSISITLPDNCSSSGVSV